MIKFTINVRYTGMSVSDYIDTVPCWMWYFNKLRSALYSNTTMHQKFQIVEVFDESASLIFRFRATLL